MLKKKKYETPTTKIVAVIYMSLACLFTLSFMLRPCERKRLTRVYPVHTQIVDKFSVNDRIHYQIMEKKLLDATNYFGKPHEKILQFALKVSFCAHYTDQINIYDKSLDRAYSMALILAEEKVNLDVIIASLLYETIGKKDITQKTLQTLFGTGVVNLIFETSKMHSVLENKEVKHLETEFYRSFLISIMNDSKVILLMFANRLYEMRNVGASSNNFYDGLEISYETWQIFVPLAHRLKLQGFKDKLGDLSFQFLMPIEYDMITTYFTEHIENFDFLNMVQILEQHTQKGDEKVRYKYRRKSIHSTWNKLRKSNSSISEILDILAFRIIVKGTVRECYAQMFRVISIWPVVSKYFRDYIACPKPNGYQSIHFVVQVNSKPVEIQIRTETMDFEAEYGRCSHWMYNPNNERIISNENKFIEQEWSNAIELAGKTTISSYDFMESIRTTIFDCSIFILTPSKLFLLNKGDKLYDLHRVSDIVCDVPLSTPLKNGDFFEEAIKKELIWIRSTTLEWNEIYEIFKNYEINVTGMHTDSKFYVGFFQVEVEASPDLEYKLRKIKEETFGVKICAYYHCFED